MLATHPDPQVRDPQLAIRLAARAVELTSHEQPALLDVLAAAYAAAGRFDQAVATANAALNLLRGADSREAAASLKQRLALYEQARPYIEALPPATSIRP